jgi:hypothetical protein
MAMEALYSCGFWAPLVARRKPRPRRLRLAAAFSLPIENGIEAVLPRGPLTFWAMPSSNETTPKAQPTPREGLGLCAVSYWGLMTTNPARRPASCPARHSALQCSACAAERTSHLHCPPHGSTCRTRWLRYRLGRCAPNAYRPDARSRADP